MNLTCGSRRSPHLGRRAVPPSPRGGAVPRPGRPLRPEVSGCGAFSAPFSSSLPAEGAGPTAPCERRASRTQVCSSTRAGRRTEQQRRSGGRRRRARRCHCRCRLRAAPGRAPRPGPPPRSTPLSTSGAPRRSSSLRRPTAGCSSRTRRRIAGCLSRTRPRRPSARPGKLCAPALRSSLLFPPLPPFSLPHLLRLPRPLNSPDPPPPLGRRGQRPGTRFTGRGYNGVQRGAVAASAGD